MCNILFYHIQRRQLGLFLSATAQLALFALTTRNGVCDLPDTKNNEIGDELAQFDERQQGETKPQSKHSTEIRYVLYRLYTIHTTPENVNSST